MPEAASSSSSPASELQLRAIALDLLYEHPLNANLMPEGRVEKLTHNIGRSGRYPPLIVRAHPELSGHFQILDGKHRVEALRRLGLREALCYFWPCDDAEALVLLATLNRLEGEDVPARRADLLAELSALLPPEQLAELLPEDAAQINDTIALLDLDAERLLADLELAATRQRAAGPRLVSFAVLPEDEAVIEEAIAAAAVGLDGRNTRGRALGLLARRYLDGETDA